MLIWLAQMCSFISKNARITRPRFLCVFVFSSKWHAWPTLWLQFVEDLSLWRKRARILVYDHLGSRYRTQTHKHIHPHTNRVLIVIVCHRSRCHCQHCTSSSSISRNSISSSSSIAVKLVTLWPSTLAKRAKAPALGLWAECINLLDFMWICIPVTSCLAHSQKPMQLELWASRHGFSQLEQQQHARCAHVWVAIWLQPNPQPPPPLTHAAPWFPHAGGFYGLLLAAFYILYIWYCMVYVRM